MDEAWEHYAKWKRPVPEGQKLYDSHWHEVTEVIELIESRVMAARGGREEEWGLLFKGTEFQLFKRVN